MHSGFRLLWIVFLAAFAGITASVAGASPVAGPDTRFLEFLSLYRDPALVQAFSLFTTVASQTTAWILFALALAYLYFKKEFTYLYALLLTFIGSEACAYGIKILVSRDRPGADIASYLEKSGSFPSGHATVAAALLGFIVYYLARHIAERNKRWTVILLGAFLVALIGFSRLYLGEHYLSDVLGGLALGGFWLTTGILFRERLERKLESASLNKQDL